MLCPRSPFRSQPRGCPSRASVSRAEDPGQRLPAPLVFGKSVSCSQLPLRTRSFQKPVRSPDVGLNPRGEEPVTLKPKPCNDVTASPEFSGQEVNWEGPQPWAPGTHTNLPKHG